jgi:putative peptide zinc metalloprotease protein
VGDQLLPDTRLTLHPLLVHQEGDAWIVGRQETGQFVEVPAAAVTLLRALEHGESVANAESQVLTVHACKVDGLAFVRELVGLGFVSSVGGEPCGDTLTQPSLRWLRRGHIRWLFTWPAYLVIFAFITWSVLTALLAGNLVPGYHAYFVTSWQGFNVAWGTALVAATIGIHELAHLAAARSEDVHAKIGLGTRLVFLCAQTTVSGLWGVSRKIRLRVYLAGSVSDLFTISCCLLALRAGHLDGFAGRSLQALMLVLWLGIAGQLEMYMRTDGYFVLQELLRCKNLYHDAWAYLRYAGRRTIFIRATPRNLDDPTLDIPAHERLPVKIYSVLMLLSTGVTLAIVALYVGPITVTLFARAFREVFHGVSVGNMLQAADGTAAIAVEGALLVLLFKTFISGHRPQIICAARPASRLLRRLGKLGGTAQRAVTVMRRCN